MGRLEASLNGGIFFTSLTDCWGEACGHQTAVKVATLDALRLLPTRMAGPLSMTFSEIECQHHTCYDILCALLQYNLAHYCNNVTYWNNLASYWSTVTDCINRQVTAIM